MAKRNIPITITIPRIDMEPLTLEAEARGSFYIHGRVTASGEDARYLTVTHKASLMKTGTFKSLRVARRMADELEKTSADWSATDPKAVFPSQEAMREAFNIVRHYRID